MLKIHTSLISLAFAAAALVGCAQDSSTEGPVEARDAVFCAPDDAAGQGLCQAFFGYKWNGESCVGLSGCKCVGTDCGDLPFSINECVAEHSVCEQPEDCDAQQAVGQGLCQAFFGYKWDGESCVGLSGCKCVGPDCGELPLSIDECVAAHSTCEQPADCDAQDAAGKGLCQAFFGYKWNGESCVGLSGCKCVGTDCGELPLSIDECLDAHSTCEQPEDCAAMDAAGQGICKAIFGYSFNGQACVPVQGCSCVGDDCDKLFDDPFACQDEFAGC